MPKDPACGAVPDEQMVKFMIVHGRQNFHFYPVTGEERFKTHPTKST